MSASKYCSGALLIAGLVACSPELDWRELRPEGSGIVASFPCKPDRHARDVSLAGASLRMNMLVCRAGGATFALAFADLPDPGALTSTMVAWRAATVANLRAPVTAAAALQVPGMTPNVESARLSLSGRAPDGTAIQEQAALFSRGLRAYQATVLGERLPAGAADAFFAGLRFES